ncbi:MULTISPECIES: response regulator [unclassified Leisingera]|uniref:response regulator n=1 Tax=unclassified Leisingera TaxID=2614906 RepID=UPI0003023A03|nr:MULTISPECIES: response regulator [unclassified Leisingera]
MAALNILLIDDDAGDRKLLRRLLKQPHPDASISEADSGEKALGFAGQPADVIFLDYLLRMEPGST